MNNTVRLKKCIITSLLAGMSVVLYVIGPKFKLPFFPSFLTINFSMVPIFVGIIVLGAQYGVSIVGIRFIIGLMSGSSTAGIGETADLIIGLCLVLFTWIGKLLFNNKAKYVPMFLFAILGWIIGGLLSNSFALPMYINVLNAKGWVVSSMHSIISDANESNYVMYYFLCAVLPFNALLSFIVVGITYLLYLPLHKYTDNLFDKTIKSKETVLIDDGKTDDIYKNLH